MSPTTTSRPTTPLGSSRYVTDGGLETDLIFHHGVELPQFAAYPLIWEPAGRDLLRSYYADYAQIADAAGAGLLLESPTWRASIAWGRQLGHSQADLDRANRAAIELLHELAAEFGVTNTLVTGAVGPCGDGYAATSIGSPDEACAYHLPQVRALADAGVQVVCAYTLGSAVEAVGFVRAARLCSVPVAIAFTTEVDGTLPGGGSLTAAMNALDAEAAPDYMQLNCAHPTHLQRALDGMPQELRTRIRGVRVNASRLSHAELDEASELDEGDLLDLVATHRALEPGLPALQIIGGCCGTDSRHVAALWDRREH